MAKNGDHELAVDNSVNFPASTRSRPPERLVTSAFSSPEPQLVTATATAEMTRRRTRIDEFTAAC